MMYEHEIKQQLKKIIQSLSGDIAKDIEKVKLIILLDKLLSPNERNTFIGRELEHARKKHEENQALYLGQTKYLMKQDEFKK